MTNPDNPNFGREQMANLSDKSDKELDELIRAATAERERRAKVGSNAEVISVLVVNAGWSRQKADRFISIDRTEKLRYDQLANHGPLTDPGAIPEYQEMVKELKKLKLWEKIADKVQFGDRHVNFYSNWNW